MISTRQWALNCLVGEFQKNERHVWEIDSQHDRLTDIAKRPKPREEAKLKEACSVPPPMDSGQWFAGLRQ